MGITRKADISGLRNSHASRAAAGSIHAAWRQSAGDNLLKPRMALSSEAMSSTAIVDWRAIPPDIVMAQSAGRLTA